LHLVPEFIKPFWKDLKSNKIKKKTNHQENKRQGKENIGSDIFKYS